MRNGRWFIASLVVACSAIALLPALANAYTVTVHMHGSGQVDETTARNLTNCTTGAVTESTTTDCIGGTANGLYAFGDIVNLHAQVPQTLYDRGWRFLKWVDSGAGGGQINCDPQGTTGDQFTTDCQFQIFENLQTNLYFDDTFGPNATSISNGPNTPTKQTSATFSFDASDDPDASYECRLDRPGQVGTFSLCGTTVDKSETYTGLTTNGTYYFYVRGRDPSGNVDTTPASYSWTIDTVAPTVTISGTPANGATTGSTSTSFTVSSTEGSPSCTIDGAPWGCGTPKTGLADGSHTFQAVATDAAGNTGSTSRTWTVDTVAPTVTITGNPADGATTTRNSTAFTVQTNSGTLSCTIDGSSWPCNTAKTDLSLGSHTFVAQATDGTNIGNDSRTWNVVSPETTITSGPNSGAITGSTVTFGFSAAPTAECSIDGGPFVACTSPQSYTLPGGSHSFSVRAKDGTNIDPSPASRTWIIDADGDGSIVPQDCRDTDSSTHPGATDTPGDGIDQDCSGADAIATQSSASNTSTPAGDQPANPAPSLTPSLPSAPPLPAPTAMPATVTHKLVAGRRGTTFKALTVGNLPTGSRVSVSCRGRGCPRKSFAVTVKAPTLLLKPFTKVLLRPGSRLTITISRDGFKPKTVTYLIRAGKKPQVTVS